jgi:hypothetical protein
MTATLIVTILILIILALYLFSKIQQIKIEGFDFSLLITKYILISLLCITIILIIATAFVLFMDFNTATSAVFLL